MNRINKGQLAETMAENAGITKAEAGRAIDAFARAVQEATDQGGSVVLQGFGTFAPRHRAAPTGVAAQGHPLRLPADGAGRAHERLGCRGERAAARDAEGGGVMLDHKMLGEAAALDCELAMRQGTCFT